MIIAKWCAKRCICCILNKELQTRKGDNMNKLLIILHLFFGLLLLNNCAGSKNLVRDFNGMEIPVKLESNDRHVLTNDSLKNYFVLEYARLLNKTPQYVLDSVFVDTVKQKHLVKDILSVVASLVQMGVKFVDEDNFTAMFNLMDFYIYNNIFNEGCQSDYPSITLIKGLLLRDIENAYKQKDFVKANLLFIRLVNVYYYELLLYQALANKDFVKEQMEVQFLSSYNVPPIFEIKDIEDLQYFNDIDGFNISLPQNINIEMSTGLWILGLPISWYRNFKNNVYDNLKYYLTPEFFTNKS